MKSICLNMIVKNESHVIEDTLKNILNYIPLTYWVISDTGSTDNTKEIITDFFKKRNIKGELVEHEWKDFGYNRTKALESAYNKTDYLFIFDADDRIYGDLKLPQLTKDSYHLKFGKFFTYNRPLLVNNRRKWAFIGVLHEYLTMLDGHHNPDIIQGDYYIDSGKSGARSQDPNKYLKDAKTLSEAFYKEKDQGLADRYAFYCAQSYKDCNEIDRSIEWYEKVLTLGNWNQEKYYSCITLGSLFSRKGDNEKSLKYLLKSIEYDPERIEGIVDVCNYYYNNEMHLLVNLIYNKFKGYNRDPKDKLFLTKDKYNDKLEFYNSISAYYVNDDSGYECCRNILINQIADKQMIDMTCSNILFYDIKEDKELFNCINRYIRNNSRINPDIFKVWDKCINLSDLTKYQRYNFKNKKNPIILISFTTCKRLDLFKQTIHSILNTWTDYTKIDYWFCVDDNSSEQDRKEMQKYNWIDFYWKNPDEKGHRKSMNIIWDKLNELKPKYWIHMEDDFLFFKKYNYVETSIKYLDELKSKNIHQVLFNRNYAETIQDYKILGHSEFNDDIALHEHKSGSFEYSNCHYWPHYSFRPSMVLTETILKLGNYDSENQFFEMDYANKWNNNGYKSAFFNGIFCKHIGKLTSEKDKPNAYTLNNESQFTKKSNLIKIINLERRLDRKEATIKKLKERNINNYEFVNAVDGKILVTTPEIKKLFTGNDFNNRRGVIGCALSHYNLWKKLLLDEENNYYLIMEDDINICENFNDKIDKINFAEKDIIFFGYSMFEKNRNENYNTYNNSETTFSIQNLNKELYIGGIFCYSISKTGARKMIDYIEKNGIKHGIDYLFKINSGIECYESHPQLAFTNWNENGKKIDTDIQNDYEELDLSQDEYIFIKNKDQHGFDLSYKKGDINEYFQIASNDPNCVAFNTLGFFKNKAIFLQPSIYFSKDDGIYIKKSYYEKNFNKKLEFLDNYQNKKSNYCFIHSCTIKDTNILDKLVNYLLDKNQIIERIFIINIGKEIENKYGELVEIIQYSEDTSLFELKTLEVILNFSLRNPLSKILYLHTKGISYNEFSNVEDWKNYMLYFLINKQKECASLLNDFDTVGVNYLRKPHIHWSGNYWWATAKHISSLNTDKLINKADAEWWIFSDNDNVKYHSLFNTNIDHYLLSYSPDKYVNKTFIRVKMICNWCSSYDLCLEWSNMCKEGFTWNNIEITWEDHNIDYYVIINKPYENTYYDPKRTIVFQMEPWVKDETHLWGVKTWEKWANPDNFMEVRGRNQKCHNNAFWQLELNYNQLKNLKYENKIDKISSICSSKYFDEGHIARINFLKFLEEKGDIPLDIFNQDNNHNFKNYRGPLSPYVNKSKGILQYKYYFMVENNYEENFITEKLWEPILCETLVFYYGCPNVKDYIDERAYVQLDMNDFQKSYEIIKTAIEEDWWSERIDIIRKEKKKILDELAFFPTIEKIILNSDWIENINSAWKGHRLFAEWLVKKMNPDTIVELGVDYGFSSFVFANALKNNFASNHQKVYGIDLFEGDSQTGFRNTYETVIKKIKNYNVNHLELIIGDFESISKKWEKEIDILHIDGYHTYEAVKSDYNNWSRFVKNDGIILFHDVCVPDYGVKDFFKELDNKLYFKHSAGLGVYTKNKILYQDILNEFNNVFQ